MKDENLVPTRLYRVFLLHEELQKRQDDVMIAEDVRVGPSGAVEFNRVWSDADIKTKVFYNGPYFVIEMDEEEIEEFKTPDCDHNHLEDEDDE